jgi:hypothetical protein
MEAGNIQLWHVGMQEEFTFRIAKLHDYAKDVSKLEASENPFATVVLASCKALETRRGPPNRRMWKLRIVKGLYLRNWSKEKIDLLFGLIDEMMQLPEELEKLFDADLIDFEGEKSVKYVSGIERIALRKGREQGREEGRQEGLLEGIALLLDAKFGASGLKLLSKVHSLSGLAQLRKFSRFVKKAETLADVQAYFD